MADRVAVILGAIGNAALDWGALGHQHIRHPHLGHCDDRSADHEPKCFTAAWKDVVRGDRSAELVNAGILDVAANARHNSAADDGGLAWANRFS